MKTEQKNKIIFWNVDTQYDFMRKDGKLYVKDAETIEPNLAQLTLLAEKYNLKVINTADWHTAASKEISKTPDFITTFPEHCIEYTQGADFVPATWPNGGAYLIIWSDFLSGGFGGVSHDLSKIAQYRNIILRKDAFDVFAGDCGHYTEEVLKQIAPKSAVVYGVATNVCVNYAVEGLLKRNVKVYVPLDAIKELPNLPLQPILDAWKQKGAVLTKTSELEKIVKGEM